jgi:hypothetical protein
MWRLEIYQIDEHGDYSTPVAFDDESINNLLDIIRYLNECNAPSKTEYILLEVDKCTKKK